jgi:hypothetical protein
MLFSENANHNERAQSRTSIIARWMLLVPACAIPLVIAAWHTLSAQELAGIGAGIATWTAAMIRLHVWRLSIGRSGETTRLTLSAIVLMAVEWLVLGTAPSIALLVIYAPSAILVSAVVPDALTNVDPLMAYLVTLVCGAQALGFAAVIWWVAERVQCRLNQATR